MAEPQRVAIVTGGAGGLGRAIVGRLSADGLLVAIADVPGALADGAAAEGLLPVPVDVTQPDSARSMVAEVVARWGGVDVLVNGAGIAGMTAPVADYPPAEFRRVIEVNLMGVLNCTQASLPELCRRPASRIVNIASVAGLDPNPGMSAYSASKAAVVAFTRSLAKELVGTGVLANTVVPGVVDAGLTANATEDERRGFLSKVPLGRMARPEEIAELVAWVASPRCSFSTGATFDASGGRSPI